MPVPMVNVKTSQIMQVGPFMEQSLIHHGSERLPFSPNHICAKLYCAGSWPRAASLSSPLPEPHSNEDVARTNTTQLTGDRSQV